MQKRAATQLASLSADLKVFHRNGHFVWFDMWKQTGVDLGLDSTMPLLVNLHRDHTVDGAVRYCIGIYTCMIACVAECFSRQRRFALGLWLFESNGCTRVRSKARTCYSPPFVCDHDLLNCCISFHVSVDGKIEITPIQKAETRVNGKVITQRTPLLHVQFEPLLIFRFWP